MASRCSASRASRASRGSASEAGTEAELNQLEEVILSKIQQRVPTRMNEDNYIVKAFKFHDLGNTGWIEFDKFKRALAPFTPGIGDQDLRIIFDRYATEGAICYKQFAAEFVSGIRRERGAFVPQGSEADAEQVWDGPEDALYRMRDSLYSQGPRGIISLAASFREADPENVRSVGQDTFHMVLSEHFPPESRCPLQDSHIDEIFQLFQQPYTAGQIAYDEFLQALKEEPLSAERRSSIRAAFRRLDVSSKGLVDINWMIKSFNASRHPQVSDGSRQPDEVLDEFAETLKDAVSFRRGQRAYPTSLIAWEEFDDYYKFISGCYDSDVAFCSTLQKVWDLDKVPDHSIEARAALARPAAGIPAKSRAGLHHWQSNTLPANPTHHNVEQCVSITSVLERARRQIACKGLRTAVDVVKNFYAADDDVDDLLDVYEFRRACQQSGINLRASEETICFETCGAGAPGGAQHGGKIQLQRFLRMLHGAMAPHRYAVIEKAFKALGGDPANEEAGVSPAVLKQNFAAEAHPLVAKGELDQGMVLAEFLDTFSLLAHIRGGCQNGMVAFSDFLAYYDLVSSTVESDAMFDLLMHRVWPIATADEEEDRATPKEAPGGEPIAEMVSPRRWAVPVCEAPEHPVARPRPPAFDGPSAYAKGTQSSAQAPDTHRRFARTAPLPQGSEAAPGQLSATTRPAGGFSAITKSSIVFNDTDSSELGTVVRRLRESLARRGLKGWRLLSERFQQYDYKRNGTVMRLDWQRLHRSLGLGLSPEEQEVLFKGLSLGRRDGAMDYRACLSRLRGSLSERRRAMVARLFEDIGSNGEVPPSALKSSFDSKSAPLCLVGRKDAASERQEFNDAVDYFSGGKNFDAEAFLDFFSMVSTMYKEEDEFRLMTTAAFGLSVGGGCMGGC